MSAKATAETSGSLPLRGPTNDEIERLPLNLGRMTNGCPRRRSRRSVCGSR